MNRELLLDRINCLLRFDADGSDCDEAMALMRRHEVRADELNARATNRNRPIYRPVRRAA